MNAIVPQRSTLSVPKVRRLVDDLMADLETIPDHWDPRGRVYPLSSLLALHVRAACGDGHGPEDAADFARDHAIWLRRLGLLEECTPAPRPCGAGCRTGARTCGRICSPWCSGWPGSWRPCVGRPLYAHHLDAAGRRPGGRRCPTRATS